MSLATRKYITSCRIKHYIYNCKYKCILIYYNNMINWSHRVVGHSVFEESSVNYLTKVII